MSLQVLQVKYGIPLYLPYDTAPVGFGEPFSDTTYTVASPGVFTVPGYVPTNGDTVVFSISSGGALPGGVTAGTVYYVVSASGDTFEISATSGGSAISVSSTGSGTLTTHVVTEQAGAITLPFKPGNTVIAFGTGAGSVALQSAPDLNTTGYGDPQGPGSWTTIATITEYQFVSVQLNNDWIQCSTSSGVIFLLQV
jgi:hypothetical protein